MRRIALMLDLIDDEAEEIFAAVSATSVRFAGMQLSDVIGMAMADVISGMPDAAVLHDVRSDGAIYAGKPYYRIERRN